MFAELVTAFGKAGRDLLTPAVLWRVLWPPLVSMLACIAMAVALWQPALAFVEQALPSLPWSGWAWLAQWAAVFLLLAGWGLLFYLTTLLLVALVVLPGLINHVARRDYPDLGRHGDNVFIGSLLTTLSATAIYCLGGLLSLPLLLIPGVVLVLPIFWTAWVSQRTFRYDALAEHATPAELKRLITQGRGGFLAAGIGCAVVAHVPVINLLAPGYTALVFVHLGLQRLRLLRGQQGVQL